MTMTIDARDSAVVFIPGEQVFLMPRRSRGQRGMAEAQRFLVLDVEPQEAPHLFDVKIVLLDDENGEVSTL
jgi:hypothetical protein